MNAPSDKQIWQYGIWFAVSMMFWFWVFPDLLAAKNDFEVFTGLILGFVWIMLFLTHILHLLQHKETSHEAVAHLPPSDRGPPDPGHGGGLS